MSMIYSTAFNELGAISGEPDPCTGIFPKKITLGKIKGNYGLGPDFSLELQFNPLDTIGVTDGTVGPFGYGWSLGLPWYTYDTNTSSGQLALLEGQTYVMRNASVGRTPTLDGYKLLDMKVSLPDPTTIVVLYAKGERLTYRVYDPASNNAWIESITSRSGRSIHFEYYQSGNVIQLMSITDDTGIKLVEFEYVTANITVNFNPTADESSADSYSVNLSLLQSLLDTVTFSSDLYTSKFTYTSLVSDASAWYVETFSDSNGLTENVEYRNTLILPEDGPITSMFSVSKYTRSLGPKLPKSTTTYEFGIDCGYPEVSLGNNFLGANTNVSFTSNTDTLLNYPEPYYYSNRVTKSVDDASSITEVYTYDKFHRQVELTTTQDGGVHLKTESATYYADESLGADDPNQSPIYTRPKEKRTRYDAEGKSREEVTSYTWDNNFGVLLTKTDNTKVSTTLTYYPAEGDANNCPADPNGFATHLKEMAVAPAPDLPPVSARHRTFTYDSQPRLDGAGSYYLVVATETAADDDGTAYSVRTHSYYDSTDNFTAGRKKQVIDSCITPETSTSLDTAHAFTYTQDETLARLTITTTKTGFDGKTSRHLRTKSYLSGLHYSATDNNSLAVDFAYDKLHRLVSTTMCPGTSFEATRQCAYTKATADTPQQKLTTDVSGAQSRDSFDADGKLIRSEVRDADAMVSSNTSAFYVTEEYVYDQLSRKVSETSYDYLAGDTLDSPSISNCTSYAYDLWGELTSTQYDSGYETTQQTDPVAMTVFSTVVVDGVSEQQVQSQYDVFGNVITQARFEADGVTPYTEATWVYDGFGRKISEIDPLKNETQTSYDFFSREIQTVCADGSRELISYAPHTRHRLTKSLTCLGNGDDGDGTLLGERTFDGLSRITSIQTGTRCTQYGYVDGGPKPQSATTPAKNTFNYVTQPELGYLITHCNLASPPVEGQSESVLDYTYDPKTGALLTASTQADSGDESKQINTYYLCGKIKTQTMDYSFAGESSSRAAFYNYSLGGKVTSCTDVIGNTHKIAYTKTGLRSGYNLSDKVSSAYMYDGSGRLTQTVSQDSQGKTLTTVLTYDTQGREETRTISTPDGVKQQQTLVCDLNDRVTSRSWTRDGASVRNEEYKYDSLGRVASYQCTGSVLPDMPNGYSLNSVDFTFDVCGNLATADYDLTNAQQESINNTSTFQYSEDDPTQLMQVLNNKVTEWDATLEYDLDGNMITDQQGLALTYSARGQLVQQTNTVGNLVSGQIWYDANGKQVAEKCSGDANAVMLYYAGDQLVNETQGSAGAAWLGSEGRLCTNGSVVQLFGVDQQGSVVKVYSGGSVTDRCYTPYGYSVGESKALEDVLVGYTGAKQSRVTDYYLLGNGYRGYNTSLGRFSAYDSASPLGAGGANGYMYCGGDPVNSDDPSGHGVLKWLGLTGGAIAEAVGDGAGSAAAVESAEQVASGASAVFSAVDQVASAVVPSVGGAGVSALDHAVSAGISEGTPRAIRKVKGALGHVGKGTINVVDDRAVGDRIAHEGKKQARELMGKSVDQLIDRVRAMPALHPATASDFYASRIPTESPFAGGGRPGTPGRSRAVIPGRSPRELDRSRIHLDILQGYKASDVPSPSDGSGVAVLSYETRGTPTGSLNAGPFTDSNR